MAKEVRQDNIDGSQVPPQERQRGTVVDFFRGNRRRRKQREITLQAQNIVDRVAARDALKAAGDEGWRLSDIEVKDRSGESEKGWNSTVDEHGNDLELKPESIDSAKTPFAPIILMMNPAIIGTHEATIQKTLDEIDFSDGWHGPAIAGLARPRVYKKLKRKAEKNGGKLVVTPKEVKLKYGDVGVADGHHRREKAEQIGLSHVPVQLVPYPKDKSVVLDTWHLDRVKWTAKQIFDCFKDRNKFADAKRTKFGITGTDGITRRILNALPDVIIPLQNLLPAAVNRRRASS